MIVGLIRYLTLIISIISITIFKTVDIVGEKNINEVFSQNYIIKTKSCNPRTTKSMMMYDMIERYSTEYDIPKYIAYNIALKETGYRGPFHWNYDPAMTSPVGAVGPMQVMQPTASGVIGRLVNKELLRTDLELNIMISMKLLSILHKKYGDWDKVCGVYNTGRVVINDYAIYCSSNRNYKDKWDMP